jgi:hypothetical protein
MRWRPKFFDGDHFRSSYTYTYFTPICKQQQVACLSLLLLLPGLSHTFDARSIDLGILSTSTVEINTLSIGSEQATSPSAEIAAFTVGASHPKQQLYPRLSV